MDFMGPLPLSKSHNYLLVVIDHFTLQVHLIPMTTHVTSKEVAWLFLKEIVRLHGVPDSIVSDRDSKFTSKFWEELHRLMGTKLLMSTVFHPQMDGATEQANCSISQVLRTMVCNDQKDWAALCPMVEFTLNSNISSTMGFAPFELNYGHIPKLGQRLSTDTKLNGVRQFTQQVLWNLMTAHDAIIESHVMQTHNANRQRIKGVTCTPGDLVYLSTKNLTLPKGRAKKLQPKYIGPYKVVESREATSTVTLELPPELVNWRIHLTFHASLIRAHVPNDDGRFPHRDTKSYYDFGSTDEPKWFVDEILAHRWMSPDMLEFQIHWTLGDVMWEPLAECKELEALDEYLELHGVARPRDLPRKSHSSRAFETATLSFNSNHYFDFNKLERSFKRGSTQNRYDMATPMDQDDPIGSSAPHASTLSMMDIIQASKATSRWKLFSGNHFITLCHDKGCAACAEHITHLTRGTNAGELGPCPSSLTQSLDEAWPEAMSHIRKDADKQLCDELHTAHQIIKEQ